MTSQTVAPAAANEDKPWESLFGVCAAVGEDFGFNPLWLRIVLGVSMLWNPVAVVAVYAWMGIAVLASRLLFPNRRKALAEPAAAIAAPAPAADNADEPELPLAA